MQQEDEPRYTFSFAAPEENATAWNLSIDNFAQRLEQGFENVQTRQEGGLGPRSSPSLTFYVELEPDDWLEGLVTTPFEGMGSVLVNDVTPTEAARFAIWLRDSYAPEPHLVEFTSQLALANGLDEVWPLPAEGGTSDISATLRQHIDSINAR